MSETGKLLEATKPFREEINKLRAEIERLTAKLKDTVEDRATISLQKDGTWDLLKAANLQIDAWRPVIEAAKVVCQKERWPYLNVGPLAHALDALHKTNESPPDRTRELELQNDDLRGEIVKVKTMCAEWENRTLNPSQVESIWGICHNALTMHKTNDSCKDPTDDERRPAKEAQDRKFRPPDWTRSGRHG